MAIRYCGALTVRVRWDDAADAYIATVRDIDGNRWKGRVGAPASLTMAVDCSESYDAAARAALSFAIADDAVDDLRELDPETCRYVVRRRRALAGEPGGSTKNPWLRGAS